jgi:transcription antitermination factor NusG
MGDQWRQLAHAGGEPQPAAPEGQEWFAVQVWTGREQRCADRLSQRRYEVLLPSYPEFHRWSDRLKRVERPLFPGYLFCRTSAESVGKIVTTPWIIRIVGSENGPVPVAAEEVAALKRVVDQGLKAEPWDYIRVGERVRICDGPLTGAEGLIVRTKSQHRLILSVSLLARSVAVEIDSWCVQPTATAAIPLMA